MGRETTFFDDWRRTNSGAPPDRDRPRRPAVRRRAKLAGVGAVAISVVVASVVLPSSTASADPSATTWHRLRMCESSNNYSINTGNGYYGAYQFDLVHLAQRRRQRVPQPGVEGRTGRPRIDALPDARLAAVDLRRHPRPS